MPNDPITCHCDEGCGLPHIHRNPPYDTDGRNVLHRKLRDQRVPEPRMPMPLFEDEENGSTPSPKEEEIPCDRPSALESCDRSRSRGGENQDGAGSNSNAQEATDVEGHAGAGLCGGTSDSGKDETIKQELKSFCDVDCGREAAVKVGKVNLCAVCLVEFLEDDFPGPRLRVEEVVRLDRPLEDDEVV